LHLIGLCCKKYTKFGILLNKRERKLEYIASSKKDLENLPEAVKEVFIHGFELALIGEKHPDAKPMKSFGNAGLLEIREQYKGDAYRAMYTVRFEKAVYVLHVFKKKSKSGIATPKKEIELIKTRLKMSESHYKEKFAGKR
jgi:phage-related protein